jgi:hypothetical protein
VASVKVNIKNKNLKIYFDQKVKSDLVQEEGDHLSHFANINHKHLICHSLCE